MARVRPVENNGRVRGGLSARTTSECEHLGRGHFGQRAVATRLPGSCLGGGAYAFWVAILVVHPGDSDMSISIGQCRVGPNHPSFIVAELSGNHNGDVERAVAIVHAAADAGA